MDGCDNRLNSIYLKMHPSVADFIYWKIPRYFTPLCSCSGVATYTFGSGRFVPLL